MRTPEIHIVGPCNSGKTTMAILIERFLRDHGIKTKVEDIDLPDGRPGQAERLRLLVHKHEILGKFGPITIKVVQVGRDPWKDDFTQFARLLAELYALGINQTIREAEWQALEASMDLEREKIMEIFHRADKAFERIKDSLRKED